MKKVLVYGLNKERSKIVEKIAKEFGIDLRFLTNDDLNEKVGDLFIGDGSNIEEDKRELLIFSDFDRIILREFLLKLKSNGVVVNHKCVLTDTNKDWTLDYLIGHIEDEHRMVMKFRKIGGYVQVAQKNLEETKDLKLKMLVEEAMSLRNKELDEALLDKSIANFKEYFGHR